MAETIIDAVRATAAKWPQRIALVCGDEQVTYAQLMARADAAAQALLSGRQGAASSAPASDDGEVAGLLCGNRPEFAYGLLGALAAKRIVAVLPTMAPPPLLAMMAEEAGVRRVLTTEDMAPRLAEAKVETHTIEGIVASSHGAISMAAFHPPPRKLASDEQKTDSKSQIQGLTADSRFKIQNARAAVLLYTSGSTGRPKAVALSDANILANIDGSVRAAGFSDQDVMLAILPLFHAYGLTVTLLLPLVLGARSVMVERFVPRSVLGMIERHRVTGLVAVPTQYRLLAKEPAPVDASSLRLCIAGAERLSESAAIEFEARFGKPILQGYGATEAAPVISINPPAANRMGAVGEPLPNLRVTVRDGDRVLDPGKLGEVCVEGPNVMLGYYNHPEATAEKIVGGVLRTGDQGWLDTDGYLHLAGRADDLIKVAGEKIYPAEVEQAIEQIDGVDEVAVLGVPDATRGSALVAFVQAKPGAVLTEAALRAACRGCVDGMKMPRSFVLLEQLPRTPTGKLDKRLLAEKAAARQ